MINALCSSDFLPEVLTSSRCKSIYGGKCCWTVYHRSKTVGNVNTKEKFKEAYKRMKKKIPHGSEEVAYGRYGSADYGIFLTYGNEDCMCPSDFRKVMMPFPILGK